MKQNFFDSKKAFKDEVMPYFNMEPPINFNKLHDMFNINFYGVDFELLKMSENIKEKSNKLCPYFKDAVGMVHINENEINLYYNTNYNIDIKEQRYIIANEIAYCEYLKNQKSKDCAVLTYDDITLHDETSDITSDDNLQKYIQNNYARQILMPKTKFEQMYLIYIMIDSTHIIDILSDLFDVPERAVIKRCEELGLAINNKILKKYNNN